MIQKEQLVSDLKKMAQIMAETSAQMDSYSFDRKIREHAHELANASTLAYGWADGIDQDK